MIKPLKDLKQKNGYIWLVKQGMLHLYPWEIIIGDKEEESLEIRKEYILETRDPNNCTIKDIVPFAAHQCQDDYAGFIVEDGVITDKVLVVHLTWRGDTEIEDYPDITIYNSFWEWLEKGVVNDLKILEEVASILHESEPIDKYVPIETDLGFLYGRDCIYLNKTVYGHNLILEGKINGNLCGKEQRDRFIPYRLTFKGVLAVTIVELDSMYHSDSWNAESCFDEINNSSWIKNLGGKVTSEHKHFSLQTYDDVFEVVCESYDFDVLEINS